MNELQALVEGNVAGTRRAEQVVPTLAAWFDAELMALHGQLPTARDGVLMGAPVWGRKYIERMAAYSLATVGAARNIKALSGRCTMVFYTTMAERPLVWRATRWLRQSGVHTVFRELPAEVLAIANAHPEGRYAVLATVQNLLGHMAAHAGMGLHMWMVDHGYSDGYFERLLELRKRHAAILQQGLSVNIATAAGALDSRRDADGWLAIPDRELGGIALQHMHSRSACFVMNDGRIPDRLPDGRQVSWIGRDAIHIADPCQNLAWVCPELCLDAPIAFMSTLDMLPPEYVPPGAWHMAEPDDGLTFCELSDEGRIGASGYVGLDRFLLRYWHQVQFLDDYTPYFETRCRIPIPPQADGLPDDEIERQHQWFRMALRSGKHQTQDVYFRGTYPSRWPAPEPEPLKMAAD